MGARGKRFRNCKERNSIVLSTKLRYEAASCLVAVSRYFDEKLWASMSPVSRMKGGFGKVRRIASSAERSSHQLVSCPYWLNAVGWERSRIASHCVGAAPLS